MLKEITEKLLHEESPVAQKNAAENLYFLLSSITEINDEAEISCDATETLLSNGKAISTRDAARCVLDFARTAKFLRGVYAAVLEARKRFPKEKINVLYAGCGPFAPFALLICTQFAKEEIGFTLLDIHERSLRAARKVFETFGLSEYVNEFIECDAAKYIFNEHLPLHLVITETMQKALAHEPQLAITLNLVPHLCEGGLLVPQRIEVNACLAKLAEEFSFTSAPDEMGALGPKRKRIALGCLLDLSIENLNEIRKSVHPDSLCLPRREIVTPDGLGEEEYSLMLLTKVTTFDSIALDDYESGITYPTVLHDLRSLSSKTKIEFQYFLDQQPGFKYKKI